MDIWSVGCIMAELLTSKTLFPGNDHILLLNRLTRDLRKSGKGWKNCVEREWNGESLKTNLWGYYSSLLSYNCQSSVSKIVICHLDTLECNQFCVSKRGLVGNTQLFPHAKMLLVPMSFSPVGRLCSRGLSFDWANLIFATYFIPRGCDTHVDILWLLFLVGMICLLM